jgi:hypothetical protein
MVKAPSLARPRAGAAGLEIAAIATVENRHVRVGLNCGATPCRVGGSFDFGMVHANVHADRCLGADA